MLGLVGKRAQVTEVWATFNMELQVFCILLEATFLTNALLGLMVSIGLLFQIRIEVSAQK